MSDFTNSGERVQGASGLSIFFRSLRPKEKPRAVVIIVPGFNAHSGYYAWVAEQFVATGLAVYAVDLRGRGNSDGERFYVANFDDYVSDVEAVAKVAKSREPGLPVFILGHSAGGVVSCLYTLDHQAELAGLICESFAYELPAPDFALAVFKGLGHLAPHAHILHLPNERFSRDPKTSVLGVKLVTSMTSVSPSQWPRESPNHCLMLAGRWGLPFITMLRCQPWPWFTS